MMLLNGVMELVGVAGLWPVMLAGIDPDQVQENSFLNFLQTSSGYEEHSHFVLFLLAIFVVLVIFLNICGAVTLWMSVYFSQQVRHHLSKDLLKTYLEKPYLWYLGRNTSALTKDVLYEVDQITQFLVFRFLEILTNGLSGGLIFVGLVLLEPYLALGTIAILTILYSQIFRFFRNRLQVVGEERKLVTEQRFKVVTEALAGIKEAKAFERRSSFLSNYDQLSLRQRDVSVANQLIAELPRFVTEALAVVAVLGAIVYFSLKHQDVAFPLTGVYIMATFRLVPAAQKVYRNAVDVKFYLPALYAIHEELVRPVSQGWLLENKEPLEFEKEIQLSDISFHYPDSEKRTLKNIDLHIPKNSSLALIGRTGDGKTTLADVVAGHLEAQAGTIAIDGEVLTPTKLASWRRLVGTVPQDIFLVEDTVRHNIALGSVEGEIRQEDLERAAQNASIHDFIVNELPQGYDTVLGERGVSLSGGQRQRLGIARALYHDPPFLILDEATNALDNLTEKSVLDAITNLCQQKTLLVIAHRLSTIKACDQVCFLKEGEIQAIGTFDELESSLVDLQELVNAKD